MGWSSSFKMALQSPSITPLYYLNFLNTGANGFGGGFYINSWQGNARIASSGPTINGVRVIPSRWNVTLGGFSVPVVGDIRGQLHYLRRGILAELMVDLGTGFERVAAGQLRSITGTEPNFIFQFVDLISAFSNTQNLLCDGNVGTIRDDVSHSTLFPYIGKYALTTVNWITGPTLSVDELKLFHRETGLSGILRIVNTSNQEFYFSFNAKSATSGAGYLNVTSGTVYPTLQASISPIPVGSKVYSAALLKGFPGHILGKIILSTGNGTNGILDSLPAEWSVGGSFDQSIYDYHDVEQQKQVIQSQDTTDAYEWNYPLTSSMTSGLRDFISIAAKAGQWPVWRQDSISWRGAIDPLGPPYMGYSIWPVMSISDKDIIEILSHEFWSSDAPNIVASSIITHSQYSTTQTEAVSKNGIVQDKINSVPSISTDTRDNSFLYSYDPYSSGGRLQRSNLAFGDLDRMACWDFWPHEKVVLKCHLTLSVLTAGDYIVITSQFLYGPDEASGETYEQRSAMVISVDYSFSSRTCTVGLAIPTTKRTL